MAKPIARKKGVHKSEGVTVSFSRDSETGLYKKIEQKYRVNHLDHVSKKIGKPEVSDDLYEISNEEDYDHKFDLSVPGGKSQTFYLKKCKKPKGKK